MMMKMTINIVSLYLIKYDNDCESLLCGDATPRPHRYSLHSLYRGAAAAAFLGVAVVALRGGGGGRQRGWVPVPPPEPAGSEAAASVAGRPHPHM